MKLAVLFLLVAGVAQAQTQTDQDNWVRCEAIRDDAITPGKIYRGVKVYVQHYEIDQQTQQKVKSDITDKKKAWFGEDQKLRDAAGAKCQATVASYSCELGDVYTVTTANSKVTTTEKYRDVFLKGPNLKTPIRFNSSDGWTNFWDGPAMSRCRRAIVELAYDAMSEEMNTAETNAKKKLEKDRQAAFDKASMGNANKL